MGKIAVASEDGRTVASHFGKCRQFLIFTIQAGNAHQTELRVNPGVEAGRGCGGDHSTLASHGHEHFVELFHDCDAVICGGMGLRAAAALEARGILPFTVNPAYPPQGAVLAYLAGQLTRPVGCECEHH